MTITGGKGTTPRGMAFLFAVTIHAMVGLRSILLDFDPSHAPSAGSTAGSGCWAQRRWFGGSSS